MGQGYAVHPIEDDEVDSAFVLAGLCGRSFDLEGWRDFCLNSHGRGEDEIAVATNARGYVQGLAILGGTQQPGSEFLDVSCFVVASAADEAGVGMELVSYIVQRARALGGLSVRIHLSGGPTQVLAPGARPEEIDALLRIIPKAPDSSGD